MTTETLENTSTMRIIETNSQQNCKIIWYTGKIHKFTNVDNIEEQSLKFRPGFYQPNRCNEWHTTQQKSSATTKTSCTCVLSRISGKRKGTWNKDGKNIAHLSNQSNLVTSSRIPRMRSRGK